jgi:hypothetical protein
LLHETAEDSTAAQPRQEWHLLHNWTYLGTYASAAEATGPGPRPGFMFDRDTYFILRRILRESALPLLCAETLSAVRWPGADSR